ncbi:hypothetical protein [Kitasatospora sp. NPDC094011]|uniref:hypothetical protein n=1 Tax=Kitasatospora sp. NPDC094011 TaxID=3364090 RepID=UPI0037FAE2E8
MNPESNAAKVGERLHRDGWRKAFTVEEMVERWARLIDKVERGYGTAVADYTNELYCRNWLHEAWPLLDEHTVLRWTARIQVLDRRFVVATVEDDGAALGRFHRIPASPALWWWRRHPRVLVGEFGDALLPFG